MSKSESTNQEEDATAPLKESRRSLLGFIIFSVIEEAVIGIVAFLVLSFFFPLLLIPGVICVSIGLAIFTIVKIHLYSTSRRLPVEDSLVGKTAIALEDFRQRSPNRWEGMIRVQGETWRALAEVKVSKGESLRVTALQGLVLRVAPLLRNT
ncbi:MAG: NfeD family protein [Promethearchaeota archaeon]